MARYVVKVAEEIKAYIYVEVEAENGEEALENAREKAFQTPLNCWTITDEDGDMQYEEEGGKRCDNCGADEDRLHDVHRMDGDHEHYCQACYDADMGGTNPD
jgi:hypothetical protein